ncbi:uncharacterized protein LOC116851940 [Odontomachus brunneus]|uniref:uncharacterized protein LOC116851940 n=1 Tax=Odontomachus brunneus TaxID=486640 RepID=UPI0013F23BCA|nr:uncharacterized protein LOC116851940 [Odontomachus brunneus]
MQTSVIFISVLAIAMMTYGYNADKLRQFYDNLAKCSKILYKEPNVRSVQSFYCALTNDHELINMNGEIETNVAMQKFNDVISDPGRLEQAHAIYIKCYKEAIETGVTGYEQTMKIIACGMPIMDLIDKLN